MEPTELELTIRTGNRERQRRHRKRQKQKRARALEAQRLACEREERMRRGPHFFGESSPGRNAKTLADELQIHREFLRALGKEDVQDGETLRSVAKRAFEAWLKGPYACRSCGPPFYAPAFNRVRQQFDPDFGFGIGDAPFETIWTPPKDCTGDEVIEVGALPRLPRLSKAKPEKLETTVEALPAPTPPVPIPQQQPNAINFAWIPPNGQRSTWRLNLAVVETVARRSPWMSCNKRSS
jgi:hypothetical protein